jgi:zinc D-Ala-D-Ala carboxypeptidase
MAETLTTQQAKRMLKSIGFDNASRDFVAAVKGFQIGWNLGAALDDDGDVGPLTSAALRKSFARHRAKKPTMSAHFSYVEFRCKCGGKFADCQRIWLKRTQVRRLEAYRKSIDQPVRIISGCRCKGRNKAVGGAKSSQHKFGAATDIEALVTVERRREKKLFAGLGFRRSSRKVVHVDSRDKSGHNLTGGSPAQPTEWEYAT